jgi:hypothetical protein
VTAAIPRTAPKNTEEDTEEDIAATVAIGHFRNMAISAVMKPS